MSAKPELTPGIAWAAAHDAGCRSMRKAGRLAWNEADLYAACKELERLTDFIREVPPEPEPRAA